PNGARVVVLVPDQLLGQHHRREYAADLRGMDARRDEDYELAVDLEPGDLSRRGEPRIREQALDAAVLREVRDGCRVGDVRGDERPAERRLAERVHLDSRRRLFQRMEV